MILTAEDVELRVSWTINSQILRSDLAGVPSDKMTPCGERPLLAAEDPFLPMPGITRSGVEYSMSSGSPWITGLAGDRPNRLPN